MMLIVITLLPVFGAQPVCAAEFSLQEATIDDVHAAFKSGQLTCRQLVQHYLNRIEAYDKNGPRLNAIQNLNQQALQEADRLDNAYKLSGPVGPLHCIPVLVKDQVETSDMPTTFGSLVFKDFMPKRDATIILKMKKAGAIIIAKATMGEYASKYVGSASGIVRNAYDPTRNASGSSGGNGSGIAANFATVGIGEDTGGSIRGPSAVASLVGLRPTVPLVSRFGALPVSPTMDTLGPMTRTVKDAAILLDVIAGYDANDPLTAYSVGQVPDSYVRFLHKDGLKGARIGVIREPTDPNTDTKSDDYKKVRAVIDRAISDLRALGAEVVDPVAIPKVKDLIKQAYSDNTFETEQAINKYLGQHANAPAKTLREIVVSGKVVPWRLPGFLANIGKTTNDAGYLQVLIAKEELRQAVLKVMADNKLDVLTYATFDYPPTPIAPDVLTNMNTKDGYGVAGNRFLSPPIGFPAMVAPAGYTTDELPLPVGIEFLARPFAESTLFRLVYAYEQGTRNRKPSATAPPLRGEP